MKDTFPSSLLSGLLSRNHLACFWPKLARIKLFCRTCLHSLLWISFFFSQSYFYFWAILDFGFGCWVLLFTSVCFRGSPHRTSGNAVGSRSVGASETRAALWGCDIGFGPYQVSSFYTRCLVRGHPRLCGARWGRFAHQEEVLAPLRGESLQRKLPWACQGG